MIIRKKSPRPHPPGTPFRHENHPRPVSRRDFLAAGCLGAQGMVIGSAWLGSLLKSQNARAGLDGDIVPLLASNQCNVPAGARRAAVHLLRPGGRRQSCRLRGAGGRAGRSGELPLHRGLQQARRAGQHGAELERVRQQRAGPLVASDGAILRGILSVASATTLAGINGAVIPAMSQNDTPVKYHQSDLRHRKAGAAFAGGAMGTVLPLVGTESSTYRAVTRRR